MTRLAMVERVCASTQNQAFIALLLLFREVLHTDMEEMGRTVMTRRGLGQALAVLFDTRLGGLADSATEGRKESTSSVSKASRD